MRHTTLGMITKLESATFDSAFRPFQSVKIIPCRVALQQCPVLFILTFKNNNYFSDTVYFTLPKKGEKLSNHCMH